MSWLSILITILKANNLHTDGFKYSYQTQKKIKRWFHTPQSSKTGASRLGTVYYHT